MEQKFDLKNNSLLKIFLLDTPRDKIILPRTIFIMNNFIQECPTVNFFQTMVYLVDLHCLLVSAIVHLYLVIFT